jgi:hypothetical protein
MTATTIKLNQFMTDGQPSNYGEYEVDIPGPYHTINEMEMANRQGGYHYFDANAKRFFRSRIIPHVIEGRFFIDSTQFVSSRGEKAAREYKIVAVLDSGSTSSVIAKDMHGDWQERFPTLDSAKRALKRIIEGKE